MKGPFDRIPSHWKRARIDRVADVSARIGWKALTAAEYQTEGIAFLSTPNLKPFAINFHDVNFISEWRYEESPDLKLRIGDVLLVKDGNTLGITNLVRELPRPATVNGSIAVIRPTTVESRFLRFVLDSTATQDQIDALRAGMGVPHLFQWDINRLPVPLPPSGEQRAIADFLDSETARIDELIAKKHRLGSVFGERCSALRMRAFDHLDAGWRLKRLLGGRMAYGVLVPRFVDPGDGARMIRTNAISSQGTFDAERFAWIEPGQSMEYKRTIVRAGDLILSVVGTMGRSAVVDSNVAGANLNRPLSRLQPRRELPVRLLWHWTQTPQFLDQAHLATEGDTAQPTLNLGDLAEFRVGLPADYAEWPALLETLEAGLRPLNRAAEVLTQQVGLLQEHRQALITAAVTGTLKVA